MCLLNVTFFLDVNEHWEHLFSVLISCTRARCFFSLSLEKNSASQTSQGVCFLCSFVTVFKLDFSISVSNPPCFACLCIWKTCEVANVLLQHSIFDGYQSEKLKISPIISKSADFHTSKENKRESARRTLIYDVEFLIRQSDQQYQMQ